MQLEELLTLCITQNASDLHLSAGNPPWFRIDGDLCPQADMPTFGNEQLSNMLLAMLDEKLKAELKNNLQIDFAFVAKNGRRFRVNIFRQQRGIAATFRVIADQIPSLEQLSLPKVLQDFALMQQGLILVTGATGSGKSTTLASMLDFINQQQACHIITIEDPIEFIHISRSSLINQREVKRDTKSFADALRAALREDPDILLVGELRDLETIRLALTAAETGHLVFATLHTSSAAKTINRIIDVFPGNEQQLVRTMLADSLRVVVAQALYKRKNVQGRVAATEIMVSTPAIANLIRENKIAQIPSQLQTGASHGMHTLAQDLERLKKNGFF